MDLMMVAADDGDGDGDGGPDDKGPNQINAIPTTAVDDSEDLSTLLDERGI